MGDPATGGAAGPGVPPPEEEDRDRGLAPERTHLAQIRTAVSFSAVGAAVVRWHVVPGIILLALGLVVWAVGRLPTGRGTALTGPARAARLRLISAATLLVAVVALVLAFTAPGPPTW